MRDAEGEGDALEQIEEELDELREAMRFPRHAWYFIVYGFICLTYARLGLLADAGMESMEKEEEWDLVLA
jgi:hypothetical protein